MDMEDDNDAQGQGFSNSFKDVDPQDIKVTYVDTPSPAKSPMKKPKKSKAERELLKRKMKYFKMVANKKFDKGTGQIYERSQEQKPDIDAGNEGLLENEEERQGVPP